jgi:collagenase-like PrtC family protease
MNVALTLGPLLHFWPADEWRDFYFRIADEAPVDRVCIGEVVCPKRFPFAAAHYDAVIDRLGAAGKEVVLSTPILIVDDRDLALVQGAVDMKDFVVEANDVAALALLSGRPHAVGPYINTYNRATAARLAAGGAVRVTVPIELPAEAIGLIAGLAAPDIEVQVFGRWPLAISARCYHARAYGRSKDGCLYACGEDPDGLPVDTLDGERFLAVNGMQTLSSTYGCLLHELGQLTQVGVRGFRLSPQRIDMVAVARLYHDVLADRLSAEEAWPSIKYLAGPVPLSNGFFHSQEGARIV